MAILNGMVTWLFDTVCGPLGGHAAWAMVLLAAVTGVWALALFKVVTPQRRLARQRDRLVGHLLEMGMYPDHLRILGRIQRDLAGANLRYLSLSLPALLALAVPMVLTVAQLEGRFAHRPLRVQEETVLAVTFNSQEAAASADLELPSGVVVAAGPVRDHAGAAVAWRLRVVAPGLHELAVMVSGHPAASLKIKADGGLPLTGRRLDTSVWGRILYPGWIPLPDGSPVRAWDLTYPERRTRYLGLELNWLVAFMIFSVAAGLVAKDPLGVEV